MSQANRRGVRTALLLASAVTVAGQLWGLYRPAPPPGDPLFPHADKVWHALGFAVPVALVLFVVGRLSAWVLGVFAAHAPISEMVQAAFYRSRSGDPWDVVADLLGVATGAAAFWLIRRHGRPPARTAHG